MTEEPVIYVTVIVFVMSEVAVFCCCLLNVRRGDCTFKGIWYHLVETESGLSNFEFYEKLISDVCDCNCIVGLTDVLCVFCLGLRQPFSTGLDQQLFSAIVGLFVNGHMLQSAVLFRRPAT